jgi:predicted PurR-regulated permease PerM
VIDNMLRPWLATFGESKIPPIVAFVCVIGGALLLGFPGLFIGLLVGSIAYDTLPIFWDDLHTKK